LGGADEGNEPSVLDLQWDMHLLDLHAGALPPRALRGVVDGRAVPELEPRLLDHASRATGAQAVIDCAELDAIDGDGVAMLERVATRSGKRLRLIHLSPACARRLRDDPAVTALDLG
jgi:hypothetical protein